MWIFDFSQLMANCFLKWTHQLITSSFGEFFLYYTHKKTNLQLVKTTHTELILPALKYLIVQCLWKNYIQGIYEHNSYSWGKPALLQLWVYDKELANQHILSSLATIIGSVICVWHKLMRLLSRTFVKKHGFCSGTAWLSKGMYWLTCEKVMR